MTLADPMGDEDPAPPAAAGAPEPADLVAAAVLAVPGVTALHPGAFGEAATYLPGRRVHGVRIGDGAVEVHVVLAWGVPVLATADEIRRRVAAVTGGRVDVSVEDLADADAS